MEMLDFVGTKATPKGFVHRIYNFKCDCGTIFQTSIYRVRNGTTKSCGCLKRNRITKHGLSESPEYAAWEHMHGRCRPTHQNAKTYYHKGIRVADEWSGSGGFERFFAHIGPRPSPGHSVDRIDNSKGYQPGNVRWATRAEQARNRDTNRFVRVGDDVMCLHDAMDRLGLNYHKAVKTLEFVGSAP